MSTRTRFATPRFQGKRFEGKALPVDLLPDLVAYRDLVVRLAKHIYNKEHGRKRVPRRFEDAFQLYLSAIEDGSAAPALEQVEAQPHLGYGEYYHRARDVIDSVVSAAHQGLDFPLDFPRDLAPYFNRIGRRLLPDEYVEFIGGEADSGVVYDQTVRKKIALHYTGRYESEMTLLGVLEALDVRRHRVGIDVDSLGRIDVRCEADLIRQAKFWTDEQVSVRVIAVFDQDDELRKVRRATDLRLAREENVEPPSDLGKQFGELEHLDHGWFDPESQALDPLGLLTFRQLLERAVTSGKLPRPYLYPSPDGEVRAEWSLGDWEVSATADFVARSVYLNAANLKRDDVREATCALEVESGASALVRFVRKLSVVKD